MKGESTEFQTTEVIDGKVIKIKDTFRAYENFAESADDYGRFLNENRRYKNAFLYKNSPLEFSNEIAKAGYATDPNYAQKMHNAITNFYLTDYDE